MKNQTEAARLRYLRKRRHTAAASFLAVCCLTCGAMGLGRAFADVPSAPSEPAPFVASDAQEETASPAADIVKSASAAASEEKGAPATSVVEPELKPRFRMRVTSIHQLVNEILRSHSGTLVREVAGIMLDTITRSADGLDHDETLAVIDTIRSWPDTSADLATFAPDIQGRSRLAIRLDWPVADLRTRLGALLNSEAAREILSGIRLRESGDVAEVRLRGTTLGYVLPAAAGRSMFATHADLILPEDRPQASAETTKEDAISPLLSARLNLSDTEKDSGATAFSSFSVITAIQYSGRVDTDGTWREKLDILWPPISGMGLKAFFGKIKQTFFVPTAALGAVALNAAALPGVLDTMAGFVSPWEEEGGEESPVTAKPLVGPLTAHGNSELGVVLLPGTGFLPAPDFVIQSRLRKKETVVADLRKAVGALNRAAIQHEAREEWQETEVDGRPMFWRDSAVNARGLLPFTMKTVVFTTSERDARNTEKEFLVLAWTTTSPEALVRRWLAFPRTTGARYVPTDAKTSGEVWINWKDVYRLAYPYVDLVLNVGATGALLPHVDRLLADLTDGRVTAQVKFQGLNWSHQGPLPIGVLALPIMFGVSLEPDTSGASDLAREQFAVRRLQVLYHHAKLFRKDLGRWPVELHELDGYVDFAAHPELLRLPLSSGKQWSRWFAAFSKEEKGKASEEDDAAAADFDADLYGIEWKKDRWSLGYAPNTFEHLERLYIDHQGMIHRVAAKAPAPPAEAAPVEASKETSQESPTESESEDESSKE